MDSRLISYLYYFNIKRDYYECHEYGESLWLDSGRPLVLKGLIQAAVCLYHLENGNVKGGYTMWLRAREYLAPHLPACEGLDLAALIADIDGVFQRVPPAYFGRVLASRLIAEPRLPAVSIRLVDAALAERLADWRPEPLPDR